MLNLPETLENYKLYLIQRDLYIKIFIFTGGVFSVIDELRAQVSEVSLLQLMPGLYVGVIFSSYLFLLLSSYFLSKLPANNDTEKIRGTKTTFRIESKIEFKSIFTLFSIGIYCMFQTILPISLDSFNSYGEKNIESIWSYDEFIAIETSLLTLLAMILQIPLVLTFPNYSEKEVQLFPLYLKNYIFIVCVLAGVLTPTVDALTQIGFILVGISLYILMNSIIKKSAVRAFSL